MLTTRLMRVLEENSEELGVSKHILMENAGNAVAEIIKEKHLIAEGGHVTVLCGTGNNGGDGFVAARHLSQYGYKVSVVVIGRFSQIRTGEALTNFQILRKQSLSIKLHELKDSSQIKDLEKIINDTDLIVDAMLGTGIKGEIRSPFKDVIELANKSGKPIVAVDTPTGLNPDTGEIHGTAIKAKITVTFHDIKAGLVNKSEYTGDVVVAGIGIPPEAFKFVGIGDLKLAYPPRPADAHKGDFGRVLVIGGSSLYSGAPILASLAAYKAGVDLVFVITSEKIANVLRGYSPSLIVREFPGGFINKDSIPIIEEHLKKIDAILLGPGIGLSDETKEVIYDVFSLIKSTKRPVVVDADGLKYLAELKDELFPWQELVITPHTGEFRLFLGAGEKVPKDLNIRMDFVKEKAKRLGITILLKGHIDIISDGSVVRANRTGNPSITVGGTGDVLAGLTVGLLARGNSNLDAACVAAYINGLAGDLAVEKYGPNILPDHLLEFNPRIIKGDIFKK
ncbi:MAG: NAD(P)H-hydrate dehydratase [Candidatus Asgardarchaeia archaeon]